MKTTPLRTTETHGQFAARMMREYYMPAGDRVRYAAHTVRVALTHAGLISPSMNMRIHNAIFDGIPFCYTPESIALAELDPADAARLIAQWAQEGGS